RGRDRHAGGVAPWPARVPRAVPRGDRASARAAPRHGRRAVRWRRARARPAAAHRGAPRLRRSAPSLQGGLGGPVRGPPCHGHHPARPRRRGRRHGLAQRSAHRHLARRRSPPRGSPAVALGRRPRSPDGLGRMSTGIASVDRLIERAAAALDAPGSPEVGLDTLGRAMKEGRLTPELLDDAGRKGSAVVEHALARAETADATLRETATRLLAEQPALGAYASRRAVMLALRERHPRHARVVLKPEAVLTPFAGIPPCPPVGARYQHLLERPERYWSDPVYEALVLTAPVDLPESAMLAL